MITPMAGIADTLAAGRDYPAITDAVLVIHGGSGVIRRDALAPERDTACREGLREALQNGGAVLRAGGSALEAVCAAVCCLEDNPLFNAGRGAVFTYEGHVELDAAIMDGAAGGAGAVTGVRTVKNPVLLARAVMERSPFVLLVGRGAEEFASAQGMAAVEPAYFTTPERQKQWHDWKQSQQAQTQDAQMRLSEDGARDLGEGGDFKFGTGGDFKFGTVGAVARDSRGGLAAATSTGGMTGKRYGRVGDSPLIDAGTWASSATCAVSATGHGEPFIRQAVAHDIHARMAYGGATLAEAARAVIHGTLLAAGGAGGVIALDANGNAALPFNTSGMYRGILHADGTTKVSIYDDEP